VAAGKDRGENAVEDVALAHDPLRDLAEQILACDSEPLEQLDVAGGGGKLGSRCRSHCPKLNLNDCVVNGWRSDDLLAKDFTSV